MAIRSIRRSGPFVLSARLLLLLTGALAIGLGLFNLYHEFHIKQVNDLYAAVALLVAAVWVASLILAFLGSRLAVFVAGALALIEFSTIASTHFVIGPNDIDNYWKAEGLAIAPVLMGLLVTCLLVFVSAIVAFGTPGGHAPRLDSVPVLAIALLGAVLVILQATDDIRRADFGSANAEDGTFAAAVLAAGWLLGALWMARVRRVGAILIALSTFGVWYSFLTLHLLNGIGIDAIAKHSGLAWAGIAAGAAILAAASFVFSLGVLVLSLFRRPRPSSVERAAVRRA